LLCAVVSPAGMFQRQHAADEQHQPQWAARSRLAQRFLEGVCSGVWCLVSLPTAACCAQSEVAGAVMDSCTNMIHAIGVRVRSPRALTCKPTLLLRSVTGMCTLTCASWRGSALQGDIDRTLSEKCTASPSTSHTYLWTANYVLAPQQTRNIRGMVCVSTCVEHRWPAHDSNARVYP